MNREPEPVLVSACLLGRRCRWDGAHNRDRILQEALEQQGCRPVPFCPEERGGLSTPRPPAWIVADDAGAVIDGRTRVLTDEGRDVTAAFLAGARAAADECERVGARRAFLKERSPSCGVERTHVGGELVSGSGVCAEILRRTGIEVIGVEGRRT